jgi:periplasmic protein CpxP/Spy
MKKRNIVLTTVLAGSVLTLAVTGVVTASPRGDCGQGFAAPRSAMFHGGGRHGHGMGLLARRLNLTQAQRDKIFKIRYDAQPAMRDKMKALRQSRLALRDAATSDTYNAEQVHKLAQAQANVMADLIAMRTEIRNRVYHVLTPDQQAQVKQWRQNGPRRGFGPGFGRQ